MYSKIEEFIESVLIIDDREDEITGLKNLLEKKDISVKYLNPQKKRVNNIKPNKNLIFLDLHISNTSSNLKGNLSEIRNTLKKVLIKTHKPYGIVLWTKHLEDIEDFKEKILKDKESNAYQMPLFIISLDKLNYLQNGFSGLFEDLEKELKQNTASLFFINWYINTQKGAYKTITDLYSLLQNFNTHNVILESILKKMAIAHSGISEDEKKYDFKNDAFKAVDDMYCSNLKILKKTLPDELFATEQHELSFIDEMEYSAKINSKLLIEEEKNEQQPVFPGTIYKVKHKNYFLTENINFSKNDLEKLSSNNKQADLKFAEDFNALKKEKIAIEITPPCDFQNKKHHSKLIGGYLINVSFNDIIGDKKFIKKTLKRLEAGYRYIIWPIFLSNKLYIMYFNFHCELTICDSNLNNEKIFSQVYKAKPPLFADILQKYASNKARLGIAILQPKV